MKCAITGANGYVGMRIAECMEEHGASVVRMVRNPANGTDRKFVLGEDVEPASLHGIDVLVHCAYDFAQRKESRKANIHGSHLLFKAAKDAGVRRIIYISSLSAYPGCKSVYGKTKMEIERDAASFGAIIVRPGLVYDDDAGSLVGKLRGLVKKTRVVPLVGTGKQVQFLCHAKDLAKAIHVLATSSAMPDGPVTIAWQEPVKFKEVLQGLASRKLLFIPVPYTVVLLGLRSIELVGVNIGLRSDSLIGLQHTNKNPDFSQMESLGIAPRAFQKYKGK